LSPFSDFVVIEHILLHLPLTNPSMLWHLWQVSKGWCIVVGGTTAWTPLEIIKSNNPNYQEMKSQN
jgi:hypothetical protein